MKKNKLIIAFLLGIFTTVSLVADLTALEGNVAEIFNFHRLSMSILGVFLIFYFYKNIDLRTNWLFRILSIILSIFLVIGYSYSNVASWYLVFGKYYYIIISIIKFICFYQLLVITITKLYNFLLAFKDIKLTKIKEFIFDKKPFLAPFLILLICWLPYIISFYPGTMNPDSSYQIMQFLGIENKYTEYEIQLDKGSTITNHHPVLHTFLLGGATKIGEIVGNTNLGIFIYTGTQILFFAATLAFTLYYMKKLKTPFIVRFITLLIYAFVPIFPLYSICTVKDVLFSILIILYSMMLFDMVKNKNQQYTIKKIILSIVLIILVTLIRNNGLYVIILSFPFLFLIEKKNILQLLIILIISLGAYFSFTKLLLPHLKITPGSIRETLSVPFQQTARFVGKYKAEITDEEYEIIDKVLDMSDLASRYNPELSDPVKNKYNKYATNEDLKKYFEVWYKQLLKHPNIYFEATINNVYGYVYPDARKWYVYYEYDKRLKEVGVDYSYNSLDNSRKILSDYGVMFPDIPVLGLIVNIAINTWVLLALTIFIIYQKKYKYLIFLAPSLILLLICFASPANTYYRYALPYIMAMPITLAMIINILRSEKNERKK